MLRRLIPGYLGVRRGPQTMNVVESVITRNFRMRRRSAAISSWRPRRRNDELFFEGGERIVPAFLKQMLSDYKIEDGKFHIAGPFEWRHCVVFMWRR